MSAPTPRPPLVFQVEVDTPAPQVEVPVGEPVVVLAATEGKRGPVGPGSPFQVTTQAEFDAMPTPRPAGTLFVVT